MSELANGITENYDSPSKSHNLLIRLICASSCPIEAIATSRSSLPLTPLASSARGNQNDRNVLTTISTIPVLKEYERKYLKTRPSAVFTLRLILGIISDSIAIKLFFNQL